MRLTITARADDGSRTYEAGYRDERATFTVRRGRLGWSCSSLTFFYHPYDCLDTLFGEPGKREPVSWCNEAGWHAVSHRRIVGKMGRVMMRRVADRRARRQSQPDYLDKLERLIADGGYAPLPSFAASVGDRGVAAS